MSVSDVCLHANNDLGVGIATNWHFAAHVQMAGQQTVRCDMAMQEERLWSHPDELLVE